MTLTIREGIWLNRDGEKVTVKPLNDPDWPWVSDKNGYHAHGPDGKSCIDDGGADLVAIWQDGPVVTETVTKTRIVPGVYDRVTVWARSDGLFGIDFHMSTASADELDAAAAVLSALAKGLRDA